MNKDRPILTVLLLIMSVAAIFFTHGARPYKQLKVKLIKANIEVTVPLIIASDIIKQGDTVFLSRFFSGRQQGDENTWNYWGKYDRRQSSYVYNIDTVLLDEFWMRGRPIERVAGGIVTKKY